MRRALALVAVAACSGHGPQQIGAQPSWRHGGTAAAAGSGSAAGSAATAPEPTITFSPPTAPVKRYNEALRAPASSPLGDAMITAVRDAAQKAGLPPPIADARLFEACEELAQIVPPDGVLSYPLVEFALQRNGIIEPSPRLLVAWDKVDETSDVVDQFRAELPDVLREGTNVRFGIGAFKRTADGTGAIVFAIQSSGVTTSPIPRAFAAGGSVTVDAVVDAHFKGPEVLMTREDGSTEQLAIRSGRSGGFKTQVACGKHIGRQRVEISASDAQGSTVLANFPVWCGTEPPASLTFQPSRDDAPVASADEAEKRLLALMNRDRQAAGLTALIWDDRVAQVARKYSDEMRRTKVVAHISPTSGSNADRLAAANIKSALELENVARAYAVGEAHEGLMNSPGHRANLMSPAATHVGVGVALGDEVAGRREMFVTQVFIRIPPTLDRSKAVELVRSRIEQVRPVTVSPSLTHVAQQFAEGLAAGRARDALWPGVSKQIDGLSGQYQRVGSVVTAFADLDIVDAKELLADYKPDDIGIGIAQGTHPEIGENAVWVVVLMAERIPQVPPKRTQVP